MPDVAFPAGSDGGLANSAAPSSVISHHHHQRDAEQPLPGARRALRGDAGHRQHQQRLQDAEQGGEPRVARRQPAEDAPAHPPGGRRRRDSVAASSYGPARLGVAGQRVARRHVISAGSVVGRVEVGTAAAAGDQLPVARRCSGRSGAGRRRRISRTSRPGRRDDRADEVVDRVVRLGLVRRLDPGRRAACTRMTRSSGPSCGPPLEVGQLRVVEVGAELLVDREQPPVARAAAPRSSERRLLRCASRRCGRPRGGRRAAGTRSGRRTSRGCPAARTASGVGRPAAARQRGPVRAP